MKKNKLALLFLLFNFSLIAQQSNIVLFYLDDAPVYSDPLLTVTIPNINRIKDSSMVFKNNYAAISLCAPSRAVLMTGNYPTNTRVIDNSTQPNYNLSLPTLGEQLRDHGYYTAVIGKFDSVLDAKNGADWDYRLESTNTETASIVKWKRNGGKPKKAGNDTIITKIITDTAIKLIQTINEPLFLLLAYRCPHTPIEVPSPFDNYFSNDEIQFGVDTIAYDNLYPDFMYNLAPHLYKKKSAMINIIKKQYRAMAYFDFQLGRLLTTLEQSGKLENTTIIFTSDNGFLNDQHNLTAKRWGFKQSVEIPLYIWDNDWFESGESNLLTSSVDLYATILHKAGLNAVSQGYSIKKLYDGDAIRELAYSVSYHTTEIDFDIMAGCKTVWDKNFKLMKFNCTQKTEMFFNLQNDSLEMFNLINESAYQDTIDFYRSKMIELSIQYGDTLPETTIDCNLIEH